MTETEFMTLADRTLVRIGAALDAAIEDADADIDWSLNDGILEVVDEEGGKIIVNRHVPNRELWVAAKGGGFHFRIDAGEWRDTRGGGRLAETLQQLVQAELGVNLGSPALPAG